ncbi:MAG: hypothetical protein WC538_22075 [Thermoanaerobaculia bacterium]
MSIDPKTAIALYEILADLYERVKQRRDEARRIAEEAGVSAADLDASDARYARHWADPLVPPPPPAPPDPTTPIYSLADLAVAAAQRENLAAGWPMFGVIEVRNASGELIGYRLWPFGVGGSPAPVFIWQP